ncbi:ABC transporter permease subunit [Fulvivirga sp. M361]|uniref:ABC transporter permease subunit n=1 Tax=Fulvivirga sp. M361 TaxID=2594266 RepID=UPI001624FAD7|nr:ABC transporter permease subunit [Fulvivirga sp. M361]
MWKLSYYILGDLIKNRIILGYLLFLSVVGWGVFFLESQPEKALLVLMQVALMAVPLIVMVFATIYYYNSREFILLILTQPIARSAVIKSFFAGLSCAFILSFLIGIGLPLVLFYPSMESFYLIISGLMLSLVFIAIALYVSIKVQDKARGMGVVLLLWVFFAFLYDGFLIFFMYQFSDYPIEEGVLVLTLFNPIDIARITIIMKTEASAMMGLSGAVFREFFGSSKGVLVSLTILVIWWVLPFVLAGKIFSKKDM